MCRFLETIRIEKGIARNLPYHQNRLDRTFARFFPDTEPLRLENTLKATSVPEDGTWKCRVLYDHKIQEVTCQPYREKEIRTLKLNGANDLDYGFKYADRIAIEKLMELRDGCDDVLIVQDNLVADTSYCNILFFDGTHWLTPDKPLLAGTKRQFLLDSRVIREARITVNNLDRFEKFMLVNAMLDFDLKRARDISGISG